jgi:hypothetical protein
VFVLLINYDEKKNKKEKKENSIENYTHILVKDIDLVSLKPVNDNASLPAIDLFPDYWSKELKDEYAYSLINDILNNKNKFELSSKIRICKLNFFSIRFVV